MIKFRYNQYGRLSPVGGQMTQGEALQSYQTPHYTTLEQPIPISNNYVREEPSYSNVTDEIEHYGSIIKDLMDTNKDIVDFELRLIGCEIDENGKIAPIPNVKPMMDRNTAKEFMNIIRSVVNQNTHFSKFSEKTVYNVLMAANYRICKFLMFQGEKVPLRKRGNISFEAMNLLNASLHKANEGVILRWSKGSISEGFQSQANNNNKRGIMDYILPMRRKNG